MYAILRSDLPTLPPRLQPLSELMLNAIGLKLEFVLTMNSISRPYDLKIHLTKYFA